MPVFNNATALVAGVALVACVATGENQSGSADVLLGEEWVVEDIAQRGVIDDARPTIMFGQDGRLSGDTSCNRYFADYQADGTGLRLENAGATRRACDPAVMDQERRFLNVFNAVDSYHIDSTGTLVLTTPMGTTITARRATGTMPR